VIDKSYGLISGRTFVVEEIGAVLSTREGLSRLEKSKISFAGPSEKIVSPMSFSSGMRGADTLSATS